MTVAEEIPGGVTMREAAVVFLTHRWNDLLDMKFRRIQAEVGAHADVYILAQKSRILLRLAEEDPSIKRSLVMFDVDRLPEQIGYPYSINGKLFPGSVHFPVLGFMRSRPDYKFCFVIEYDVEFSGNWGDMISRTLRAEPDLASLHFFSFDEKPNWQWFHLMRVGASDRAWAMDKTRLMRSFNPIYCLSRTAANLIDAAHRNGWRCHYEVLFATICAHHGCKIVDFQDLGAFYEGREQDNLPHLAPDQLSTVRWRPPVSSEEFLARSTGQTLFHPVKDSWYYDGSALVHSSQA